MQNIPILLKIFHLSLSRVCQPRDKIIGGNLVRNALLQCCFSSPALETKQKQFLPTSLFIFIFSVSKDKSALFYNNRFGAV